jgi:hypothetical protein
MDTRTLERTANVRPFEIKDCALIALATGHKALSLRELRDGLAVAPSASVYHHFWGDLMLPRLESREFNNDFATWVRRSLGDSILAERLAILDPSRFRDFDELRRELIDLIEERLDENDVLHSQLARTQFEFVSSQIVTFDTGRRARDPGHMAQILPDLSIGSIFYHFIDGRRRSDEGLDDFRAWLRTLDGDFGQLDARLARIDPYFQGLVETRDRLVSAFAAYFAGEA